MISRDLPVTERVRAPQASQPRLGDLLIGIMRCETDDDGPFATLLIRGRGLERREILRPRKTVDLGSHGVLSLDGIVTTDGQSPGWVDLSLRCAPHRRHEVR